MSTYLTRMVAHAKTPVSRIHPVLRPLFAPSSNHQFADGIPEESAHVLSDRHPSPATRGRGIPVRTRAPGEAESTRIHREPAPECGNSVEADAPVAFTPLMPGEKTATPTLRASVQANSAESSAASETESGNETRQSFQSNDAAHRSVVQPLMPLLQMSPRPNITPAPTTPVSAPTDEIQIHIGRIEITAVPPAAAPRPVPRSPSRAINLDNYLRQTRGSTQ